MKRDVFSGVGKKGVNSSGKSAADKVKTPLPVNVIRQSAPAIIALTLEILTGST